MKHVNNGFAILVLGSLVSLSGISAQASGNGTNAGSTAKNLKTSEGCLDCNVPQVDNGQISKLAGVVNALDDKSNCTGILSGPQEMQIMENTDAITSDYLAGKIDDDKFTAKTKAQCKAFKDPGEYKDCVVTAQHASQMRTLNVVNSLATSVGFGHPLTDKQKEQAKRILKVTDDKDIDAALKKANAPFVQYNRKLAAIGVKFSAAKGWDYSNLSYNVKDMAGDARLARAITATLGPIQGEKALAALSDPKRNVAFQLGNVMVLPPSPQQTKDGKMTEGEVRTMPVEQYTKEVNAKIAEWKDNVAKYLSNVNASATVGNMAKRSTWNPLKGEYWDDWLAGAQDWAPTRWLGIGKGAKADVGHTAESDKMDEAATNLHKLTAQLNQQYGLDHDNMSKILEATRDAYQHGSEQFGKTAENFQKIAKAVEYAPLVGGAIMVAPAAAGGFAAMPLVFGAGKTAVTAAIEAHKLGGTWACRFANATENDLGDTLLSTRWAIAGALGPVAGMAGSLGKAGAMAKTAGEVGNAAMSAYFMGSMAVGSYQEFKGGHDSAVQADKLEAQSQDAAAKGDTKLAQSLHNQAVVAHTEAMKAYVGGAIDATMVGTGAVKTAVETGHAVTTVAKGTYNLVKDATPVAAARNYLTKLNEIKTKNYPVGTELPVTSTGARYKVVEVSKVAKTGEPVYMVKRIDDAATPAQKEATLAVFQSDLLGDKWVEGTPGAKGKAGKSGMKSNLGKASIVLKDNPSDIVAISEKAAPTPDQAAVKTAPDHANAATHSLFTEDSRSVETVPTLHEEVPTEVRAFEEGKANVARAIESAGSLPENGRAYLRVTNPAPITKLTPTLATEDHTFYSQGNNSYFKDNGTGKVYQVTNPALASAIDANVTMGQNPAVASAVKTAHTMNVASNSLTDAFHSSKPVENVPADAQPILKGNDAVPYTALKDNAGNVYIKRQPAGEAPSVVQVADAATARTLVDTANSIHGNQVAEVAAVETAKAANDGTTVTQKTLSDDELKGNVAANDENFAPKTENETEKALAQTADDNNKVPVKRKLANAMSNIFAKWKSKTDAQYAAHDNDFLLGKGKDLIERGKNSSTYKALASKASDAGRSIAEGTSKVADSAGYGKIKAAAEGHLMIEQVVHELNPVEAKEIEDKLEKDPQAEKKVEEALEMCNKPGAGKAVSAADQENEFLDSIGVLYSDNSAEENSCTL